MLFNSFEFLFLFLPISIFGFFLLGRYSNIAAIAFLAASSLFFYAYWKVEFLPLLGGSIVGNYAAARAIARWRTTPYGKALLVATVAANLIVLGIFKYYFFFSTNIKILIPEIPVINIALPIGISFFTFTQIAFLVDTWKGLAKEKDIVRYTLFVTYFPHHIAGPVLHHKQMMPQFSKKTTYNFDIECVSVGLLFLVIGLGKKILIADQFSPFAGELFDHAESGIPLPILGAWIGSIAFTFQIYFDFSGYSDMAFGISKMFGIDLPFNFNSPYKATNIIEFWRRWHMSLSHFLRDYLYIPLGGNRHGSFRRYINLLITMLLGGLWHGANWTYVIWGALHGLYLIVNHVWRRLTPRSEVPSRRAKLVGWCITFPAIVIAWVFFRSQNWAQAVTIVSSMTGASGIVLPTPLGSALGPVGHWLSTHGLQFDDTAFHVAGQRMHSLGKFTGMSLGAFALIALPNSQQLAAWLTQAASGVNGKPAAEFRRTALNFGYCGVAMGLLFFICLTLLRRKAEFLYFQF